LNGNPPGRNLQAHAEQHDKALIERLHDNPLPPVLTATAAENQSRSELHTPLDVALPNFNLTQPPAEVEAIEDDLPAPLPEPLAKVASPVHKSAKHKKGAKKPL
jgi:hypothetical protein